MADRIGKPISQRQLRVGEMIKQSLSMIFIRNEAYQTIDILKQYSYLISNILSQKVVMQFLPKLLFRKDDSFEYAEKIENLIKQTNK